MWHYVQNGQACGPVDITALQNLLKSGAVSRDTLVWKEGMADWVSATSVAELIAGIPSPSTPPPIPPLAMPPRGTTTASSATTDQADIDQNKVFAVLSYIGILFLVPLLAAPHSKFARYHANQGIVLFLAAFIVGCGSLVLLPIPFIHMLILPIWIFLPACIFVFVVIGIVNAATGQYKPLPLIGHHRLLT
jgi:uncharacterized membrane protein